MKQKPKKCVNIIRKPFQTTRVGGGGSLRLDSQVLNMRGKEEELSIYQ
jgi:hypothetical protein